MEELGIGRPSTYASHRDDDPGPRICAQGQGPPDPAGQGPAGDGVPVQLLPQICRIRLHRRPRKPTGRRVSAGDARLQGRAGPVLARFLGRPGRNRRPAHRRGAGQDQRSPRAAPFPAARGRLRPAPLPELRHGAAAPAHRPLGRGLHRLLELSRMPLHPPLRPPGDGGSGIGPDGRLLGHDERRRDLAARRPLRPLRPARRADRGRSPSPRAPACPKAGRPPTWTWRGRCSSSTCPARSAPIPRTP